MKFNLFYIFNLTFLILIGASCDDQKDVDKELLAVTDFAGQYSVTENCGGVVGGPYIVSIFNTASESADSVWIENLYDSHIQIKAKIGSDNTFAATDGIDVNNEGVTANLAGKVVEKDSIYMTVTFMEDGEVFDECIIAGHRETGFEE